jgi:CelD/BcsL family acetyltransferase involved in cellulose biosynthesis
MARAVLAQRTEAKMADRDAAADPAAADSCLGVRLSLHHNLVDLEPEWRTFEAQADGTAFQTFDWVSAWQRHIGSKEGVTPAVVIGRHRGRIIFILPLAVLRGRVRRIVWLATQLSNCNAPLLARDFAEVVNPAQFLELWREIERLLRDKIRYDLIDLDKIPETVGTQANPLIALRLTRHPSDSYVMRLTGTWDALYKAKRSSSWRKTDGKRRRRLENFGAVAFATAEAPAEIAQTLEALIAQKKAFYAYIGVANLFERPGVRDFHIDIACRCRGLVHVSQIKVGPTIAAASFGLSFHGNYDYVLAGYTGGELDSCSPGTIHMQELMRHFLERGFKTFDFNIGDAVYKREWCDFELRLYDYVEPRTVAGWLSAALTRRTRAIQRYVKQHPSLFQMARKLRSLTGRLRGLTSVL